MTGIALMQLGGNGGASRHRFPPVAFEGGLSDWATAFEGGLSYWATAGSNRQSVLGCRPRAAAGSAGSPDSDGLSELAV